MGTEDEDRKKVKITNSLIDGHTTFLAALDKPNMSKYHYLQDVLKDCKYTSEVNCNVNSYQL